MKITRKLFVAASGLLILNGLIHILSLQLPFTGATDVEQELYQSIQTVPLPSFEQRTFGELNLGVSYGVALITILLGLQNLLLYRKLHSGGFRQMLLLNLIGWAVVEGFFIRYVILPPILLWGLVVVFFFFAFLNLQFSKTTEL